MGALAEFLGTLSPRLALLWWWLAPRREAGSVVDSQQADEAAEALSRGQRHPWVLCSGVWVLGRSRSEVVHREALLWGVELTWSYSCSTTTEGFYFKKRFLKVSKENTVCSFLCLRFTDRERVLLPWALRVQSCLSLLAFEAQSCLFLSLHLLLVFGIQLTPREGKACPSTCSSSFPRHTCLINVQLICCDATSVSSFSSQKKRELSQWSWPFTFLPFFLNLEASLFEMQREENHKNKASIFLKKIEKKIWGHFMTAVGEIFKQNVSLVWVRWLSPLVQCDFYFQIFLTNRVPHVFTSAVCEPRAWACKTHLGGEGVGGGSQPGCTVGLPGACAHSVPRAQRFTLSWSG